MGNDTVEIKSHESFFFNFLYVPYIILMAAKLKLMKSSKSIC